jgi:hypothetical protein
LGFFFFFFFGGGGAHGLLTSILCVGPALICLIFENNDELISTWTSLPCYIFKPFIYQLIHCTKMCNSFLDHRYIGDLVDFCLYWWQVSIPWPFPYSLEGNNRSKLVVMCVSMLLQFSLDTGEISVGKPLIIGVGSCRMSLLKYRILVQLSSNKALFSFSHNMILHVMPYIAFQKIHVLSCYYCYYKKYVLFIYLFSCRFMQGNMEYTGISFSL